MSCFSIRPWSAVIYRASCSKELLTEAEFFEKELNDSYTLKDILTTQLKDTDDMLIQTSHLDFDNQIEEHESELLKYKEKLKLESEYKENIRSLYNSLVNKVKEYDGGRTAEEFKKFAKSL